MAQIADKDVASALSGLSEVNASSGPLLRPEQVDRITSLAKEADPEVKAQKTMSLMDELQKEAEASSKRFDELCARLGLEKGQAKRFLQGERLAGGGKETAKGAVDGFVNEAMHEIEQAAKLALGQGKMRPPRANRIKI